MLTDDERAQLAALQAKAAEPEPADSVEPVEVAGDVAAEVGAAVADAVATVAATVAVVTADVVNDARSEEADRLEREANTARVDAAMAQMRAEELERAAVAVAVEDVAVLEEEPAEYLEDIADAEPEPDSVPEHVHPYFRKMTFPRLFR